MTGKQVWNNLVSLHTADRRYDQSQQYKIYLSGSHPGIIPKPAVTNQASTGTTVICPNVMQHFTCNTPSLREYLKKGNQVPANDTTPWHLPYSAPALLRTGVEQLTCHNNRLDTLGATTVAATLGVTETVRVVATLQVTGATQHWHQEGALTYLLAVHCGQRRKKRLINTDDDGCIMWP